MQTECGLDDGLPERSVNRLGNAVWMICALIIGATLGALL